MATAITPPLFPVRTTLHGFNRLALTLPAAISAQFHGRIRFSYIDEVLPT